MKRFLLLGSTGSIGFSTLDVVRRHPKDLGVVGLSAQSNVEVLCSQIKEFRPEFVCLGDAKAAQELKAKVSSDLKIFFGPQGLEEMVQDKRVDEVVMAISGSGALKPLIKAISCAKPIVLANKEALAMAGPLIMRLAEQKKVKVKPVDSEQSAIWQCLDGQDKRKLKRIYLTASGGPFRNASLKDLKGISVSDALKHPRWKMGKKITVDSATLMNKGLELLEAMYLFGVAADKVDILIHPEAIIHSMVEFIDGVVMAQLSVTDMRIPIQYALTYPERLPCKSVPEVDFFKLKSLNFEKPDLKKFPCLGLAIRAAEAGGTMPCVLNAANEVAVEAFLKKEIDFVSIARVVEKVLERHKKVTVPGLDDIFGVDAWARQLAGATVIKFN